MSNVPFYFPRGATYGNVLVKDGILHDGLTDYYGHYHMGHVVPRILLPEIRYRGRIRMRTRLKHTNEQKRLGIQANLKPKSCL